MLGYSRHSRWGGGAALLAATILAGCSGGGGNDASAAGGTGAGGAPGPVALTPQTLVGSTWRLHSESCPGFAQIEFRADAIVTPDRTIRITFENNNIPTVLLATPEGGPAGAKYRFSLTGDRLTMFEPSTGMPCIFERAG
jgi:hypothetical protein